MLLALFLFDTLYTAIATSVYIMPYEMAISNRARSSIFLWKILFSVFWVAVPLVLERTIKPDISDQAGLALFRLVMIVLGIGMGVVIYLSSFYYAKSILPGIRNNSPFSSRSKSVSATAPCYFRDHQLHRHFCPDRFDAGIVALLR